MLKMGQGTDFGDGPDSRGALSFDLPKIQALNKHAHFKLIQL